MWKRQDEGMKIKAQVKRRGSVEEGQPSPAEAGVAIDVEVGGKAGGEAGGDAGADAQEAAVGVSRSTKKLVAEQGSFWHTSLPTDDGWITVDLPVHGIKYLPIKNASGDTLFKKLPPLPELVPQKDASRAALESNIHTFLNQLAAGSVEETLSDVRSRLSSLKDTEAELFDDEEIVEKLERYSPGDGGGEIVAKLTLWCDGGGAVMTQ